MDDFLKYYEDKRFVNWALNPNEELNEYWENYLKNYPEETEQLKNSRLILQALQSKNLHQLDNHQVVLYGNIIDQINKKTKKTSLRKIVFRTLKYAAALLFFVSLGFSYYYNKTNELERIAKQLIITADQDNAQLILADGSKVLIDKKDSEIIHQNDGEIIINQNDTVNYRSTSKAIEKYNQLIVPFGKKSSITLSDGTIAHLNAGSRLIYPYAFIGSKREVHLYGEGFFEVAHNKEKPFIVKTSNQEIEVLGTKFNVSAYPSDNSVETVLAEGSIKLKAGGFSFFKEDYILKPNQKAHYDFESKTTSITKVNASKYVSWYLGYLNLETSRLDNLVKRLERYYNIKITLKDIQPGTKTITGKLLLGDDLETVLAVLATATEMNITKLNESTYDLN
ncbi:MAG: FecR domain-containing protein [Flavobacteriaceae bacterium]